MAPGTAIIADLVVSAAPPEQSGAASALSETASEFGGALGIALLGSLAAFIYRSALIRAVPTGATGSTMETALRGIGPTASLLRNIDNTALRSAVQAAYTIAVEITFAIGAGLVLLAALVAVVAFRDVNTHRPR